MWIFKRSFIDNGVWIKNENSARIGLNDDAGNVIFEQIINTMLYTNTKVPYRKRFFEIDVETKKKQVQLVFSPLANLGADETIHFVLLLIKKLK